MGSLTYFLFVYLLGGLTFLPLVVIAVLTHASHTFPIREILDLDQNGNEEDSIVQPGDDVAAVDRAKTEHKARRKEEDKEKDNGKNRSAQEGDVAAGYFAVTREYVPMGINAKPIERPTPIGSTTVTAPSQSVYQTMYRSIFDRRQQQGPFENKAVQNQRPKNAGNVFYVVLRHGHLMLFDDEEQIEVRHVVSLAHHDISIYSGGDVTPEGELYIKRNALCLTRRKDGPDVGPDSQLSKPFYLFSEDSSAKEDFYFALLRNQEQYFEMDKKAPRPKQFDVKNIITLVQKLHASEDEAQTRWLNAMIGRIFLGLYQTADLENFIREKLTKKISRVKTPSFLTNIAIRQIDTGDSAPVLLHPRHKDLNVGGECSMEADVKYNGNFRIEVAATARLDLGPRFKAREVNLVLAVVLRKLEGHIYFKIKPPPSNRVWFSFQTMPKMEMDIEPIVSSRQITYTLILRQIESRIKEVFAETLVQPFWDDMPFFHTEHKKWRGGIWEGDDAIVGSGGASRVAQDGDVKTLERMEENDGAENLRPIEKSYSAPLDENVPPTGLFGKKIIDKPPASPTSGVSSGIDAKGSSGSSAAPLPRTLRSPSLSSPSDPVVGTDSTHADVFKPSSSPPDHASSMMAALSARNSPANTPIDSPARPASVAKDLSQPSSGDVPEEDKDKERAVGTGRRDTASSSGSATQDDGENTSAPSSPSIKGSLRSNTGSTKSNAGSITKGLFARRDTASSVSSGPGSTNTTTENGQKRNNTLAAVANAATQARQWGWNAIQKRREGNGISGDSEPPLDLNKPIGRGQPLPPPGTPLPRPGKNSKVTPIPMPPPKRKSVQPREMLDRQESDETATLKGDERPGDKDGEIEPPTLPERPRKDPGGSSKEQQPTDEHSLSVDSRPALPNRQQRGSNHATTDEDNGDALLVVEAPMDSEPSTPMDGKMNLEKCNDEIEHKAGPESAFMQPWVDDEEDVPERYIGSSTNDPMASDTTLPVSVEELKQAPPGIPSTTRVSEHSRFDVKEDDDDDFSGWLDNMDDEDATVEDEKALKSPATSPAGLGSNGARGCFD